MDERLCDTDRGRRWQELKLQEEKIKLHNVVGIRLLIDNNENLNLSIKYFTGAG
jgi:hypothetical protein